MQDFIPLGTGNSRYLKSVENFKALYPTYDAFVAALVAGTLPIDLNGINEAGVAQRGTPLNKANLLTDETASMLGLSPDAVPDDALAWLATNHKRVEIVSYTGTGESGSASPCTLTFSFKPTIAMLIGKISVSERTFSPVLAEEYNNRRNTTVFIDQMTTEYVERHGFGYSYGTLIYGKRSEDGKTISWYYNGSGSEDYQYNNNLYEYYVLAIE